MKRLFPLKRRIFFEVITGGFLQIATAVGQGAMAGKRMIEYVRSYHLSPH